MSVPVNVSPLERWTSSLAGAGLTAIGLRKLFSEERPAAAAAVAAAGAALIVRGATGRCLVYEAAGIDTADSLNDTRAQLAGRRGIRVVEAVTINQPAVELYLYWRDFERLPRFMANLASVRVLSHWRSHWVVKGPARRTFEWDAEIIADVPGELISWRTLRRADVVSAGSVRFTPRPRNRGTTVTVTLQYNPPAGKLGSAFAWLFGREPSQTIRDDLRRFKQLMETGEIPATCGQPRGAQ